MTCWNIWILPLDEVSVLPPHTTTPLNSFMWLTVSSIFSWGYYWNSFVLVEASLLAQEFCFTSASKTCQQQIRTRNSNLCFQTSRVMRNIFIYIHLPPQKSVKERWWTTHKTIQLLENSKGVVKCEKQEIEIMLVDSSRSRDGWRSAGIALETLCI